MSVPELVFQKGILVQHGDNAYKGDFQPLHISSFAYGRHYMHVVHDSRFWWVSRLVSSHPENRIEEDRWMLGMYFQFSGLGLGKREECRHCCDESGDWDLGRTGDAVVVETAAVAAAFGVVVNVSCGGAGYSCFGRNNRWSEWESVRRRLVLSVGL